MFRQAARRVQNNALQLAELPPSSTRCTCFVDTCVMDTSTGGSTPTSSRCQADRERARVPHGRRVSCSSSGGAGYMEEYRISRLFHRRPGLAHLCGASEVMRKSSRGGSGWTTRKLT